MSEAGSMPVTSRELVSLAHQQGVDLASMCDSSGTFLHDGRIIWFWRKNGVIHYSLQGKINVLPQEYKASASAFRGMWDEAGTVEDMGGALELLLAWLLDRKEVERLPQRFMRRTGIG